MFISIIIRQFIYFATHRHEVHERAQYNIGLAKVGLTEGQSTSFHYQSLVFGLTEYNPPAVFCYAPSSAGCISFTSNSLVLLGFGTWLDGILIPNLRQAEIRYMPFYETSLFDNSFIYLHTKWFFSKTRSV